MSEPVFKPNWRKPAGMVLILTIIAVWAFLIATFHQQIGEWHIVAQLLFYAIAGIVWIMPIKPLLQWMETGRWRH